MKNVDSETLKEAPYFFSVLCNWYWLGGKVDAREWVRTHSSDDKDFVELLELMHSRLVHYPGGEFRDYLDDDKVKMFFSSVDDVKERLRSISSDSTDPKLSYRAESMLTSVCSGAPTAKHEN